MRGILKEKPPMPKYRVLGDVDLVLSYLKGLPDNKNLTLRILSMKLAILLAIAAPKRVRLDLRFMPLTPEYFSFRLPGLSKTLRDCSPKQVTYHRFSDSRVCVLECLQREFPEIILHLYNFLDYGNLRDFYHILVFLTKTNEFQFTKPHGT